MNKTKSSAIIFNSINVNAIDDVSGIFVGENIQWNWSLNYKENHGIGTIVGKGNVVINPLNIVYDPDVIDYPVNETIVNNVPI